MQKFFRFPACILATWNLFVIFATSEQDGLGEMGIRCFLLPVGRNEVAKLKIFCPYCEGAHFKSNIQKNEITAGKTTILNVCT